MRQLELNLFRRLLEGRKRDILADNHRLFGAMNQKSAEGFADPTDRATHESDRNLLLRIGDRDRKLLAKIDEAFARLDRGAYGRCDECGDPISIARLKARPVTTLCINCKAAQEARERLATP